VISRTLAVVVGGVCVALTLAGCGGRAQTVGSAQSISQLFFPSAGELQPGFTVTQVRRAFRVQGIRLRRSSHETERVFGVEVPVFEAANAGPYFRVSVYPVMEPDSFLRVSVTEPGQPEPVIKWARRRNVSVDYDANRPMIRGKIMAALNSLSR
jgi:hypothetical protein